MRVFITGVAGFIGSHLAERLTARGDVVLGLDNFDSFYRRGTKEQNLARLRTETGFTLHEGDIRSRADLDRAFATLGTTDVVVHLAALAGVQPSLREPERFFDVNVQGTVRLFEACRSAGVGNIVLASSSSVYGADGVAPFSEADQCAQPRSPYAASKRAAELMAWTAHHLHDWSLTCLRFFTVYGPRQRPDLAIHKFTRLLSEGEPIEMFGNGATARDYTYIDDIIDGVVSAIDQINAPARPRFRVYNLSGRRSTTLASLVELLAKRLGCTPRIIRLPEQPGDMNQTLADLQLSEAELRYRPKVSLEEGLDRFVTWWRSRHDDAADTSAEGLQAFA
jgi:UDP-glucuronate 4-epimerase